MISEHGKFSKQKNWKKHYRTEKQEECSTNFPLGWPISTFSSLSLKLKLRNVINYIEYKIHYVKHFKNMIYK